MTRSTAFTVALTILLAATGVTWAGSAFENAEGGGGNGQRAEPAQEPEGGRVTQGGQSSGSSDDDAATPQRYASANANGDAVWSIAWDDTKEGAIEKAIKACKKVSTSCASSPAWTSNLKTGLFVLYCCTKPSTTCQMLTDTSVDAAATRGRKRLEGEGRSNCRVREVHSADDGRLVK